MGCVEVQKVMNKKIDYEVLGKLCRYLNCSVGDLLEVEKEETEDGQC